MGLFTGLLDGLRQMFVGEDEEVLTAIDLGPAGSETRIPIPSGTEFLRNEWVNGIPAEHLVRVHVREEADCVVITVDPVGEEE